GDELVGGEDLGLQLDCELHAAVGGVPSGASDELNHVSHAAEDAPPHDAACDDQSCQYGVTARDLARNLHNPNPLAGKQMTLVDIARTYGATRKRNFCFGTFAQIRVREPAISSVAQGEHGSVLPCRNGKL